MTTLVLAVEMVASNRVVTSQMADCLSAVKAGAGVCDGYAQFGGVELLVPFALSFVVTFDWFLRRRRFVR